MRGRGVAGAIAALLWTGTAWAQTQPTPPDHYTLDERGVDLVRGTFTTVATDVVIGRPGDGGLVHARVYANGGWRDTLSGTIAASGNTYTVSLGSLSEIFVLSGSTYTPVSNNGSTLTRSGSTFTFTASDGSVATYSTVWAGATSPYQATDAVIMTSRSPDGETQTYHWDGITYCAEIIENPRDPCTIYKNATRVEAVTSNRGYMIKFIYASDDFPDSPMDIPWLRRVQAIGINLAEEYCAPGANSCPGLTQQWPSVSYDLGPFGHQILGVTDQSGRTTEYSYAGWLTEIRYPGSAADDISITHEWERVSSVTIAGSTWDYDYSDAGSIRTVTTTNPDSSATVAVSNQTTGRLTSYDNELGHTTSYQYDGQRRLIRATHPEGNYVQYAYDGRGNVTQIRQVAKSGSGLADIVVSAAYPSTCTNPVICNQPVSFTDERGHTTDFTYNPTHGGVLTITEPAPTTGAARPQIRITYASHYAWYKNAAGTIVQAPSPVTLPTAISACVSGASCANAANEVRTTFAYGASGVANNLLPTAATRRDGTGSLSATTTLTWTPNGDVASVNGPLSGALDTTYFRYDAARQQIGAIGPDPDGGGPLLRRAVRNTYNSRGQITLTEQGAVTGLTDPDWAAFATLQRQAFSYDAYGRPTHVRSQSANGTNHALIQTSYDTRGRVDCVASRMNPTTFVSPPSSACTAASTGAFGPDRIMRYAYDAASQVTEVTSGHGSGSAITQQLTWTSNGQLATARDGEGNLSSWFYDGFDRVRRLRFPTTEGGTSSTTDYEEYGYDAASNVVSHRTRANQTFTAIYDALGRQTQLTTPGSMANVVYAYDNLGRPTSTSRPGHVETFVWDALSRLTSQTGPLGTFGFQYDLASRRTRITWPDAFYAQYDWSLYDQVIAIRENGATTGAGVLAQYAYDNLGRRATITRGNGVGTAYGYDAIGRMTSIAHDLAGTVSDVTLTMAYNPTGQITARTISNSLYAYQPTDESTGYVIDGRNEIVSENGVVFSYDANRNLTNDGEQTYTYDAANRLTSSGATTYAYGPLGDLAQAGGHSLASVDGRVALVATTNTGAMVRRFVPGPWIDETVAFYSASGARYRYIADHQNTVLAYTSGGGTASFINTYDEYGRPGAGAAYQMRYTGQYVPSSATGLYYYKSRFYNAEIGRFLHTDPAGYGDGLNLYAYVGNDPVNRGDPWGMWGTEVDEITVTVDRCAELRRRGGAVQCASGWDWGWGSGHGPFQPDADGGGGGAVLASLLPEPGDLCPAAEAWAAAQVAAIAAQSMEASASGAAAATFTPRNSWQASAFARSVRGLRGAGVAGVALSEGLQIAYDMQVLGRSGNVAIAASSARVTAGAVYAGLGALAGGAAVGSIAGPEAAPVGAVVGGVVAGSVAGALGHIDRAGDIGAYLASGGTC